MSKRLLSLTAAAAAACAIVASAQTGDDATARKKPPAARPSLSPPAGKPSVAYVDVVVDDTKVQSVQPMKVLVRRGDEIAWRFKNQCKKCPEGSTRKIGIGRRQGLKGLLGSADFLEPCPNLMKSVAKGKLVEARCKVGRYAAAGTYKYDIGGDFFLDPEAEVQESGSGSPPPMTQKQ